MPELTQDQFARLLSRAMDVQGVGPAEVERRVEKLGLKVHQGTISGRYRNPTYESGPPKASTRRTLEKALNLPTGFLDGAVDLTDAELTVLASGAEKPSRSAYDPKILDKVRDAALTELDLIKVGPKDEEMVDLARAIFWVKRLHKVATEVLDAPEDQKNPHDGRAHG